MFCRFLVIESHDLTVRSSDAEARSLPSDENAIAFTDLEWNLSVLRSSPVIKSHSLTVRSPDAEARTLPSGEKATEFTQPRLPSNVCNKLLQFSNLAANYESIAPISEKSVYGRYVGEG